MGIFRGEDGGLWEADEAVGLRSAELLCPYPPGIPLLVPGELITATALKGSGAHYLLADNVFWVTAGDRAVQLAQTTYQK